MPDEDEFLQMLRETFKVEADEHVQAISAGLLELEKGSAAVNQRGIIETIFRAAHSLKGAARAVGFMRVELICQQVEDVFASWKRQDAEPTPAMLDSVHRLLDSVSTSLSSTSGEPAPLPVAPAYVAPIAPSMSEAPSMEEDFAEPEPEPESEPKFTAKPENLPEKSPEPSLSTAPVAEVVNHGPAVPVAPVPPSQSADTVRISVAKLDARLLEAEEMLMAKLTTSERVGDLGAVLAQFEEWRNEWNRVQPEVRMMRQVVERPDAAGLATPSGLARLVDFFDWSHDYLRALEGKVVTLRRAATQDHQVIGKLVDDLLEDSKKLLMLPLATMGSFFPKMVRDLCRDQGKEAEFVVRGGELEVDKRILEEMKDPLVHILRNSVDHGIERPEERSRAGKPTRATITLAISPVNGNKVELLVSDDGRGIDPAKVKTSAIKHGRLTDQEAAALSDEQALDLIFQSEVSTSPIITQLSGRGLGLAIVREKAEKLGGTVFVESRRGQGTAMRIELPIALATFRGIIVEVSGRTFVVPTTQVERVGRFRAEEVRTVEGRETLSIDGKATSLVRLADVLELPTETKSAASSGPIPMMLLGGGDQRVAFAIDQVRGEQEVLVKRLAKPLSRVRNISGATVLGSGQVAPILNVGDLLKSARLAGRPAVRGASAQTPAAEAKSILVSEDSITSRTLLKGILESAGYRVKTAVDGMEAFTTLRAEHFDLLVSDVEMPRLNGFDLTARVRADHKLSELPVILVTALETREDRERGIDVGANAYLIKSSFDQSNLLEAVQRLI